MNNLRQEAERILGLVKQLIEGDASEELQAQIIENALHRFYLSGQLEATNKATHNVNEWMNRNDR
mgnify:CR=1 FL=1